ncbi:hypothetical protein VTO42DRAFT_8408 [Malbranchea cinnamomea]
MAPIQAGQQSSGKRKAATESANTSQAAARKRVKVQDARTLAVQSSDAALSKTGDLDVSAFVAAREFEIRALEAGIRNSKSALTSRAFQKVPRNLRRRTASHNVKRVPRRLRARAKREMIEDNTPTVTARRRKPTGLLRLRLETARRLQALNARSKAKRKQAKAGDGTSKSADSSHGFNIAPRIPKIKKNKLSHPEKPQSKFKKRQRCKTWLPTHMFHAKRAHMSPPTAPLWRFAIPLTPTEKSYRPTHRASGARGAIAWDMSYISTICLEGVETSLENLLRAVGVDGDQAWGTKGKKWRAGTRSLEAWVFERDGERKAIAPVTIIWCAAPKKDVSEDVEMVDADPVGGDENKKRKEKKPTRKIFVRVHPSAFLQLWEELLKVAKIQKPRVMVEDLRFDIGSIDVTGPGATEALLSALRPVTTPDGNEESPAPGSPEEVWSSLAGLTNAASLPPNAILAFDVSDPRLRYPPRKIQLPKSEENYNNLATILSSWTPDSTLSQPTLFSRPARLRASRLLPSQKAINRRKALAPPGQYPSPKPDDPRIPVIILASRPGGTAKDSNSQGCWTVLLPWKCVTPVWYSIIYYPLSSGGNPRFGGIQEKQQLAFESGEPWFPGDFPGTKAGWEWEERTREIEKNEWERKPKGKRIEYSSLDLGNGREKGEIGRGWACDWERIVESMGEEAKPTEAVDVQDTSRKPDQTTSIPAYGIRQAPPLVASALLSSQLSSRPNHSTLSHPTLTTVKINLFNLGTPTPRARIYRLPSTDSSLRIKWLKLLLDRYPNSKNVKSKKNKSTSSNNEKSLVFPPPPSDDADHIHPPIPGEKDLIGFVTTGNYNFSAGKGTGIGAILVNKLFSSLGTGANGCETCETEDETRICRDAVQRLGKEKMAKLCIVRSAGERVGRLGWWEPV